jgi:hypothetical protein
MTASRTRAYNGLSLQQQQQQQQPQRPFKTWKANMIESKGDYRDEAFLEDYIGGPLYEYQHKMPKLVVPSIQETLERFLPTATPLAKTDEERMALIQACKAFPEQALQLQQRLLARQKEFKDSSWLQLWWNQVSIFSVSSNANASERYSLIYISVYIRQHVPYCSLDIWRFETLWLSMFLISLVLQMIQRLWMPPPLADPSPMYNARQLCCMQRPNFENKYAVVSSLGNRLVRKRFPFARQPTSTCSMPVGFHTEDKTPTEYTTRVVTLIALWLERDSFLPWSW